MPESPEKDVVCGMAIEKATTIESSEFDGVVYYFCSAACKQKFDHSPQSYVASPVINPKATTH